MGQENPVLEQLKAVNASIKAANDVSKDTSSEGFKVTTLGDVIEKSAPGNLRKQKDLLRVISGSIAGNVDMAKQVRSTDVFTWRLAYLYGLEAMLRNESTPFLNFLESGGVVQVDDGQIRFDELNLGDDEAELFGIQDDLPGEAKQVRASRNNTLGAVGNVIASSMWANAIVLAQKGLSLQGTEIDAEMTRIRRKMNSVLLSGVEQKMETAGNIPSPGGFVTRSTSYNVDALGSDLTRPLVQGRINAIANDGDPQGMGYNTPLIGFTNQRQLGVLRNIIISEYGGIFPTDRMAYESELQRRLQTYNVGGSMPFEPDSNHAPITFVQDPMMPAGTTIIFDPTLPKLAKMPLGGSLGPFAIKRPTVKLQEQDVVFDLFSLIDPLTVSRALITGTAT